MTATRIDRATAGQALHDAAIDLEARGYNHGSSGNISVRLGPNLLITPTGARAATMTAADMVEVRFDGVVVGSGSPSSEWHLHAAILTGFPEAGAVVHTHADACVALSCLRRPIPAFHYMVAAFGGDDVPCTGYATFGTNELAVSVMEALRGRRACLIANHGMVAFAPTLAGAIDLTVKLETLARQYILCRQAGAPVLLAPAEMDDVRERYRTYGR
jgi:L-fuculose-phosphate aldolase